MTKKIKSGLLLLLILIAGVWLLLAFGFSLKLPKSEEGWAELSWEAAEDAKSYKVYWGDKKRTADCPPGGYANQEDAGKTGEYKITGLESGKTYYFSISAVGEGGKESCFSPESQKEIPSGIKSIRQKIWK